MKKYYQVENYGHGFITHQENETAHIAGFPGNIWVTENVSWAQRVNAVEKTKEDVSYFDRPNGYRLIVKMAGMLFIDKRWESTTFDRNRYQMFIDSFDRTRIMLRATITNKARFVIYDQCYDINNQFIEAVDNRVVIKGNEVLTNRSFTLNGISEDKINEMQTLSLEVVRQQDCRNII